MFCRYRPFPEEEWAEHVRAGRVNLDGRRSTADDAAQLKQLDENVHAFNAALHALAALIAKVDGLTEEVRKARIANGRSSCSGSPQLTVCLRSSSLPHNR